MQEGELIGNTLKIIEREWLNNDFEISDERGVEIITAQSN